jgi:glycosyltransferase involved in cell wall biosynthesis
METAQQLGTLTNFCKLTVVIIGRNEEQFIGGAIESVIKAQSRIPGLEVIFVDSASTDRSIEIAKQYPIRVLQLKKEWPLCVAAGRFTGYLHSHGEYVFFQDGDSNADADWLVQAVAFMDAHPEYGAVAGVLDEEYVDAQGVHSGGVPNVFGQDLNKKVCDCKNIGGIALYRRRAMELAGPVNPHLPTAEDHELCMRIRNAGFKVARIEGRMAVKFTENRQTIREVLRRSRTKMYDYGAVIRHAGVYGGAMQFCLDAIPYVISFALAVLFFLVVTPVAGYFGKLWMVVALAGLLGTAQVIKKGGLHGAGLSMAVRSVSTYRTILSYLRTKPKPIEDYPTDVIHVR